MRLAGAAAVGGGASNSDIWLVGGDARVFYSTPDTRRVSSTDARAVWLTRDRIRWPQVDGSGAFKLYHSAAGQLDVRRGQPVAGADGAIALTVGGDVPAAALERFKYVDGGTTLSVPAASAAVRGGPVTQVVKVERIEGGTRFIICLETLEAPTRRPASARARRAVGGGAGRSFGNRA